ncbi:cytochrome P450 [Actinomadura parmotrematis]|uniref:Cytochrome P450 n=1 Tax=Actinomadura parmotrematis TaxID=2864039 RepID=A0ABS7FQP5_9ACTN|nr:cytochrome P450 [Actinomadura parmotrematis]MBW8482719.1 cytochrome P450 [Actinomadura parmotrematis]
MVVPLMSESTGTSVATASVADTLRVGAQVLAPTVAKGILARRPRVVALAERMQADAHAGRYLRSLRARYGPGPLKLRVPGRPFALVLSPPDVRRVLDGSPEPFALATKEKRAALAHFQPHGVLASTGAERADRRAFNERVLETGRPVHDHAAAFTRKIDEEAARLVAAAGERGELTWDGFRVAWWRVIRRIVLGDAARDDSEISDLLTRLRMDANWAFAHPRRRRVRERFDRRLQGYLDRAEPGSLAEMVAAAPKSAVTEPEQQVPQWLFAYEPAGIAAFRALALLAAHPEHRERAHAEADAGGPELPFLRATVLESVRLWPTTLSILRDTSTDVDWNGTVLAAGTGLLIHTPFVNRDEDNLPFADAFAPRIWFDGTAQESGSVVPFSAGPGECPGRDLVLLTTTLFMGALLRAFDLRQAAGTPLRPDRPLPRTFGPFRVRLAVRPRPERSTE